MSPRPLTRRAGLAAVITLSALALAACSGGAQPKDSGSGLDLPEGWTHVAGESDFSGIDGKPDLPVTVTDGTGTEVEVTDASRIIAAGDGIASTLGALGLADNIYAAPDNATSPEALDAEEHFEFSKETGVEGLLAMDGTLFIGDNTTRHGEVAEQFRDAGVAAVVIDDKQPQAKKLRAVADYVGMSKAGKELAESLNSDVDAAKQTVADAELDGIRIIQVTATGAGGQNSVAGVGVPGTEMVTELGMVSVGVESKLRGFSREFSSEGILAAEPDVILLAESDYERWNGEKGLWKAFPMLADTPAGQAANVYVMPDAQLRYSSPELGAGAEALAEAVAKLK